MNNLILYSVIAVAVGLGIMAVVVNRPAPNVPGTVATTTDENPSSEEGVMCTQDAKLCPDGTYVGRTGPNCEFKCPPAPAVPADVAADIEEKQDLIRVESPLPAGAVPPMFEVAGEARGPWYFEASFPIEVLNASGKLITTAVAEAQGDWMTEEFVPFSVTVDVTEAVTKGTITPGEKGTLVFKKSNASGLPEHDDELRIPIVFAE